MKNSIEVILHGVLIWFIPIVISMFFYDQTGTLSIQEPYFKKIMIITAAIIANYSSIKYLGKPQQGFITEGISAGVIWLLINWILDIAILVPLSGMDKENYFRDIGSGYFIFPIISISVSLAMNKINQQKLKQKL